MITWGKGGGRKGKAREGGISYKERNLMDFGGGGSFGKFTGAWREYRGGGKLNIEEVGNSKGEMFFCTMDGEKENKGRRSQDYRFLGSGE